MVRCVPSGCSCSPTDSALTGAAALSSPLVSVDHRASDSPASVGSAAAPAGGADPSRTSAASPCSTPRAFGDPAEAEPLVPAGTSAESSAGGGAAVDTSWAETWAPASSVLSGQFPAASAPAGAPDSGAPGVPEEQLSGGGTTNPWLPPAEPRSYFGLDSSASSFGLDSCFMGGSGIWARA